MRTKLFLLIAVLAAVFVGLKLPHTEFDSSVLSLLPKEENNALGQYEDVFLKKIDRQLIFVLKAGDADTARLATDEFARRLQESPQIAQVRWRFDEKQQSELLNFYLETAAALTDSDTRKRLSDGTQFNFVLSQLFLPLGAPTAAELQKDPLLLTRSGRLKMLGQSGLKFSENDGYLNVSDADGAQWYLLYAKTAASGFSVSGAAGIVKSISEIESALLAEYPSVTLLHRGMVFYSDFAAQTSQREITLLGSVTVAGILLLMFLAYRSLVPLLMTALSLSIGLLCGTAALLACFERPHLIIMVMCLSVIGICTDYSVYFMTRRMIYGGSETASESLKKIKGTLLKALSTTVLAYCALAVTPFDGLRQLAVFCITGLIFSCGTVFTLEPYFCRFLKPRALPLNKVISVYLNIWNKGGRPVLTLAAVCFCAIGLYFVKADDDPAAMQAMPAEFQQTDAKIAALTGQDLSQTFVLVTGKDEARFAENLDKVRLELEAELAEKRITGFVVPSYNSVKKQTDDFALIGRSLNSAVAALASMGIKTQEAPYALTELALSDYLASPEGRLYEDLLTADAELGYAALIPTAGVKDRGAMHELFNRTAEGIEFVDRHGEFAGVFKSYRENLGKTVFAVLLIILAFSLIRLRLKQGLKAFIPALLSAGAGLAALGLCGLSVNMFTLLALILVLGIGIDYTMFFEEKKANPKDVLFSVTLCFFTTLLTLGVMVLSSTAVIKGFGACLCAGIFTSWLMAPWAMKTNSAAEDKPG